jgi:hypothetical protein
LRPAQAGFSRKIDFSRPTPRSHRSLGGGVFTSKAADQLYSKYWYISKLKIDLFVNVNNIFYKKIENKYNIVILHSL